MMSAKANTHKPRSSTSPSMTSSCGGMVIPTVVIHSIPTKGEMIYGRSLALCLSLSSSEEVLREVNMATG